MAAKSAAIATFTALSWYFNIKEEMSSAKRDFPCQTRIMTSERKKEKPSRKKNINQQRKIQCKKAFLQCNFAKARNSPALSYLAEQNFHLLRKAPCKNA